MSKELALSVILATYNRAEVMRETLRHLVEQELDPATYEVIVVDDGSPDHTRAVVEEWIGRAPFRLRYLHHANQGPGYTHNRGMEAAEAPIVLLMADDIFMQPGALKAHMAMHQAHPEPHVAVLGRVEESRQLQDSLFIRHWDHFRFSAFAGMRELPYYRFWACNVSAKRDFVLRHGPFRDQRGRAGAAAHEDIVLGYRLSRAGLRILYCPEALALHYHPTTWAAACERRYMQGLNFGEFHHHAPVPEIPVAYHVLNWRTLGDHFSAIFGPRRRYLVGADRNLAKLLVLHCLRAMIFNAVTVTALWEPLVQAAERHPFFARLMRTQIYRGTMFYHFLRGCRDGYRLYDSRRSALKRPETRAG